ncbi:MAG: Uma2 family endonuclease [Anaerolineae bacterium]|nr:Uma2 family endonuclease [Anaerolineae bacterium]
MVTLTLPIFATLPSGEVVATDVAYVDYMAQYAADFHEWVQGVVIKMSPAALKHVLLTQYFLRLLETYFSFNPIGQIVSAPFVMRLENVGAAREPDLQIIRNDNPGQLTDTAMIGPADICIEIVSPESTARDYGDKFKEYEQGGVSEYWIIDPLRQACRFYRLKSDTGFYADVQPDENGHYTTPKLPKLALHIPTLWREELPDVVATVEAVRAMVEGGQ